MKTVRLFFQKLWGYVLVQRVVHTFYQAFLSALLVGMPVIVSVFKVHGVPEAEQASIALLIAAGAAGLSAVRTVIANSLKKDK